MRRLLGKGRARDVLVKGQSLWGTVEGSHYALFPPAYHVLLDFAVDEFPLCVLFLHAIPLPMMSRHNTLLEDLLDFEHHG